MKYLPIIIFLAISLIFSGSAHARMTGKIIVSRTEQINDKDPSNKSETRNGSQALNVISMIPIAISSGTDIKNKKSRLNITLTPTSINFGITF